MENALQVKLLLQISAVPVGGGEPICWYDSKIVGTASDVALPQLKRGLLGVLCDAAATVKEIGEAD